MCTKNRKARTKRKRPKYLNLNTKLCELKKAKIGTKKKHQSKKQLFPLQPETVVDDDSTVASFLFDTTSDSTATLDGLLNSDRSSPLCNDGGDGLVQSETFLLDSGNDNNDRFDGILTGDCDESGDGVVRSENFIFENRRSRFDGIFTEETEDGDGREKLMRSAMRCKERDASEERWVSYSEVVEKSVKEEEVNSSDDRVRAGAWKRKLDLKLDYDEVLNAWSDKGSLFVDGESPQTVPDLQNDNNVIGMDSWNLWRVPEMSNEDGDGVGDDVKLCEDKCDENWRREHRVASMLKYKEKRRNRLFSKRIRYEVRKLNAEKRPRMKGRFVKRSSDE